MVRAAEACLCVYGVTKELGSAHITPQHSISSSSSPIHLGPPPFLPFLCLWATLCECSIYKEIFSLLLLLSFHLLSSLLPVSSAWGLGGGGNVNVNGALSSYLTPPPPPPLFSFSGGKYCVKAFGLMATRRRKKAMLHVLTALPPLTR